MTRLTDKELDVLWNSVDVCYLSEAQARALIAEVRAGRASGERALRKALRRIMRVLQPADGNDWEARCDEAYEIARRAFDGAALAGDSHGEARDPVERLKEQFRPGLANNPHGWAPPLPSAPAGSPGTATPPNCSTQHQPQQGGTHAGPVSDQLPRTSGGRQDARARSEDRTPGGHRGGDQGIGVDRQTSGQSGEVAETTGAAPKSDAVPGGAAAAKVESMIWDAVQAFPGDFDSIGCARAAVEALREAWDAWRVPAGSPGTATPPDKGE